MFRLPRLTAAITRRPTSSSGWYSAASCALEVFSPKGPKSIHSLWAGLRARSFRSARRTRPTRRSSVSNASSGFRVRRSVQKLAAHDRHRLTSKVCSLSLEPHPDGAPARRSLITHQLALAKPLAPERP
jgi:hypothetical protein